jgi:uncharacterized membrane protein
MSDDTSSWPVDKEGFRLRGLEMTRTETFTDAAFAFAVTLLVISTQSVPDSYEEMLGALAGAPAFAVSFLLIMTFWYGHWQWSRRYGLEDMGAIILSAALVFVVLVYVYPLKFLFSLAVNFYSGGRFSPGARLEGIEELYHIFGIYGIGYAAMTALIAALNAHAWRQRDALGLDAVERQLTRAVITAWCLLGGVGLLSAALAFFTEPAPFVWPGWVYMILPVLMPLFGRRADREHRRLMAERAAPHPPAAGPGGAP